MNPLLIRRRGMMVAQGGGATPIEIEFLESTGTQYINTNINGAVNIVCEAKVQFLSTEEQCLLGSRNSTRHACRIFGIWSDGRLYTNVGDFSSNVSYSSATNTDLHVLRSVSGSNSTRIYVDGAAGSAASSNSGRVSTAKLALFALNFGTIQFYSKARLYYINISVNNVLVFDAIPVRVGAVGYMYDRVSGQLFGNAGTGDFILGPDIQ